MRHLMLLLSDPSTQTVHVVRDHIEEDDLKDWNTAVELMGEIEDIVEVIKQTHD